MPLARLIDIGNNLSFFHVFALFRYSYFSPSHYSKSFIFSLGIACAQVSGFQVFAKIQKTEVLNMIIDVVNMTALMAFFIQEREKIIKKKKKKKWWLHYFSAEFDPLQLICLEYFCAFELNVLFC